MAVSVLVQKGLSQIIVPVSIDRAVRGAPVLDAPDVDDRGFKLNRGAGLNTTDARGPMFGITVGDTVRIRVVREDLDATAPLFVGVSTSSSPQLRIADPAGGGPLPPDGIFSVTAVADTLTGQKVEVRLGSATGPVIAEADPHVFSPKTLNVTPHICTIHQAAAPPGTGTTPTINGAAIDLNALFDIVRAVWRPAGVQFNIGPTRNEVYRGFTRDDFARTGAAAGPGSESVMVNQNRANNTCNIYFIRFMDNSLGVGVNRESMAAEHWTNPGVIIGIEGSIDGTGTVQLRGSAGADLVHEIGNDLAHELGHFLTLSHADHIDNPGLTDTYGRRHLMHPVNLLPLAATPGARFDDIGYGTVGGAGHRGCLLTLKDDPNHSSDGETVQARNRFRSPRLY
jgi:hypothetical protein